MALHRRRALDGLPVAALPGLATVFHHALLNGLFNPKALLFFMVLLPPFVTPGRVPPGVQLALFGVLLFHLGLAALAERLAGGWRRHPGFAALQALLLGLQMLRLAPMGRP